MTLVNRFSLFTCLLLPVVQAHAREWADITGKFRVMAEIVTAENNAVTLRKDDGTKITVPLSQLSKTDQTYVGQWLRMKEGKPPELPLGSATLFTLRLVNPEGRRATTPNVHGFITNWPKEKRPILVTTLVAFEHEALGVQPDQISKSVTGVQIYDAETGRAAGDASGVLPTKGYFRKSETGVDVSGSIAAFWGPATALRNAFPFADAPAKQGDTVWYLKLPQEAGKGKVELLNANVREVKEKQFVFELTDDAEVADFGGGPLLNFEGKVVGMYGSKAGLSVGYAVGLEQLKEIIGQAAKAN